MAETLKHKALTHEAEVHLSEALLAGVAVHRLARQIIEHPMDTHLTANIAVAIENIAMTLVRRIDGGVMAMGGEWSGNFEEELGAVAEVQ